MKSFNNGLNKIMSYPSLPGYLILVAAYLPGVLTTSFWSDDFPALIETKSTALNLISDTRPVWGGGLLLFFSVAKLTGLFIIPKVVGFAGLVFLYGYICSQFKHSNSPRIHYLILVAGFLLPSFGIWSHWSTSLFHSWSALLGLFAHDLFRLKSRIISVITMTISCLIYPPATVFFFGVMFYKGVVFKPSNSELLSEFLSAIRLLAIAGSVSLIFAFSSMQFLGISPTARVSIIRLDEFPQKLIWFFSHPFALGFFPMSVHSPSFLHLVFIGLPVLLVLLFVILAGIKLSKLKSLIRLLILFIIVFFSICPLLLSRDNQIELRLIPGISWGIFCSFLYSLYFLTKTYLKNVHKSIFAILSLVVICVLIAGVAQRFQSFYLYQDQTSTKFIVQNIQVCVEKNRLSSVTIQENSIRFPVMRYLGTFSMTSDMASSWVPQSKTIFILQQYFPKYSSIPVKIGSTNSSSCSINLDDFVRLVSSSKRKSLL